MVDMKFKINKMQVDLLARQFETKDPLSFEEIELEPIWETAKEAVKFEQEIKAQSYRKGFLDGYDEGRFDGQNNRIRCEYCGKSRQRMYQCYCCTH